MSAIFTKSKNRREILTGVTTHGDVPVQKFAVSGGIALVRLLGYNVAVDVNASVAALLILLPGVARDIVLTKIVAEDDNC